MLDKFRGCLLGGCIGDALGMPVEGLTAEEIRKEVGPNGIEEFRDAIGKINGKLMAGQITDDTQLTRVVAESLINCGGYDQADIAARHIAVLDERVGWGDTTVRGVESLRDGRSPWESLASAGQKTGGGNGIAMKIAPIALFSASLGDRNAERAMQALGRKAELLAMLTHTEPEATHTAFVLASSIYYLALGMTVSSRDDARNWIRDMRRRLITVFGEDAAEVTISRLRSLLPLIGDADAIAREIPPWYTAIDSVPYALGIFLTYPTDFRKAVLTAVNAGIDTDTTASMVGSLVGAHCGIDSIPEEWRTFQPFYKDVVDLADQLYAVATR